MFMISPVAAASSQGLEWGFGAGDRFDFTLTSAVNGWSDGLYINVTSVPGIPDPLNSWAAIPQPSAGTYWAANDTSVGIVALIFLGLFLVGSKAAVPIGNFSLLWSLVNPLLTQETQIDESNVWGIRFQDDINATHAYAVEVTYAKADGMMAEYKLETVLTSNDSVVESITVIRNNIPSPGLDLSNIVQLIQDNIIIVAAGVVILILLIIVCKKK